jgi:cystathionine beta-synthase
VAQQYSGNDRQYSPPLIRLNKITKDIPATVLAKVDYFNPGNSIKDRMALKMVEVAEQEGKLKPGGTIIEGTSGNTGMGLALAACVKGYKCIFVTTDKQSKEKADILKAVGAEVIVCPTNVLPDDPKSYYSVAKRLGKEIPNSMYMNQYDNLANRQAHYESTGPEIWETDRRKDHPPGMHCWNGRHHYRYGYVPEGPESRYQDLGNRCVWIFADKIFQNRRDRYE